MAFPAASNEIAPAQTHDGLPPVRGDGRELDAAVRQSVASPRQGTPLVGATAELASRWERVFLYVVLSAVLLTLFVSQRGIVAEVQQDYRKAIEVSEAHADRSVGLLFTLQLARARDAAVVKVAALCLAYLVVILGCLFVLKGVEAAYKLRVSGAKGTSALKTSSPGLVLITFGTILAGITVFVQSRISVQAVDSQADDAATSEAAPATQKQNQMEHSPHADLPPPL